jgi:hypothetical protein
MARTCFRKKDSNPPVCGVHSAVLVQKQISIDSNAPGLGHITCYICPVSQAVVQEVDSSRRNSI